MPETLKPVSDPAAQAEEDAFRAPLGLKLFVGFFVLLAAIIILDSVARMLR